MGIYKNIINNQIYQGNHGHWRNILNNISPTTALPRHYRLYPTVHCLLCSNALCLIQQILPSPVTEQACLSMQLSFGHPASVFQGLQVKANFSSTVFSLCYRSARSCSPRSFPCPTCLSFPSPRPAGPSAASQYSPAP